MLKLIVTASFLLVSLNAAVVESDLKDSAGKTIIQYVVDAPEHLAPASATDPAKNTAEFYMVLGLRDLSYHLTNVRDAYARMDAKGHHIIYREFDNLAARTYHPESNGDAIAWISRLRNKMLPLSAGEQAILQRYATEPAVPASGGFAD